MRNLSVTVGWGSGWVQRTCTCWGKVEGATTGEGKAAHLRARQMSRVVVERYPGTSVSTDLLRSSPVAFHADKPKQNLVVVLWPVGGSQVQG